ncbi:hypothetical protein SynSYN20_00670 [Synechococcus sp. SYN20]|nr:hypothetical protein SynSYN20_00670 [Synechococcus sp. SYN20]
MMGCNDFLESAGDSNFSNGNMGKDALMLLGGSAAGAQRRLSTIMISYALIWIVIS